MGVAMCGEDTFPNRRLEHEIDEVGVELPATFAGDRIGGVVCPAGIAVTAAMGNRVEGVGDGDDASREWDSRAAEVARVSGAIPAFVVGQDAVGELRVEAA